jgi:hypothetical protein
LNLDSLNHHHCVFQSLILLAANDKTPDALIIRTQLRFDPAHITLNLSNNLIGCSVPFQLDDNKAARLLIDSQNIDKSDAVRLILPTLFSLFIDVDFKVREDCSPITNDEFF